MSGDLGRNLASVVDRIAVGKALNSYAQRDWSTALELCRTVQARNASLSAEFALPLTIGHCAIELDAGAIPTPLDADAPAAAIEGVLLNDIRGRVYQLCRTGDFDRAVGLLRLIAPRCQLVGGVYRDGFLDGETADCARLRSAGDDRDPPFLADLGFAEADIARLKQRHAGNRMLLVARRFYFNNPKRRHEPVDYVGRTAVRFGMTVREWNSHWRPEGSSTDDYVAGLAQEIDGFQPHLIFYDDLFETGVSAELPAVGDQVRALLERARRDYGTRVVKCFPDAWGMADDRVFHGLGTCVDVVYHCHPAILPKASPRERAATWCYPWPHEIATPTVPQGAIPRASFVGTVYTFNYSRMVWWAEAMKRGLPIDFVSWLPSDNPQADPESGHQFSDTDFINALHGYRMSINFTRRSTDAKILTGKTVEIPMAGGCLLEEHSIDAAYILKPGIHYLPFTTFDDLAAAIETLLHDEPRRLRMVEAAQAWVTRYFSGDYFWAGLLTRVFG